MTSIRDNWEKIKGQLPPIQNLYLGRERDIFIVVTIILVGLAGFGLGKLSNLEKNRGEVMIRRDGVISTSTSSDNQGVALNLKKGDSLVSTVPMSAAALVVGENAKGMLVASKNGTKYHFPWCAGASQISEKNKIWFSSYLEAQKAGYTAAANCKGLQ